MVALQLRQLDLFPGQRLRLRDVSWQEFEAILEELGDHRGARVAYSQGTLEIMSPLPKHERAKCIIGDLVKILLEELQMDCEPFGSTTFKRQDMAHGVEPDESFYIQNQAAMVGKDRIDLTVDPPPDLAIEIEVTSTTQLSAYEALGVPELWCYAEGRLRIYLLRQGSYVESEASDIFPMVPVVDAIATFTERSRMLGRSPTLRAFRQWLRQQLS